MLLWCQGGSTNGDDAETWTGDFQGWDTNLSVIDLVELNKKSCPSLRASWLQGATHLVLASPGLPAMAQY